MPIREKGLVAMTGAQEIRREKRQARAQLTAYLRPVLDAAERDCYRGGIAKLLDGYMKPLVASVAQTIEADLLAMSAAFEKEPVAEAKMPEATQHIRSTIEV
jgi:hypothetical protein